MGKRVYACFINLSKAFELINRTILFLQSNEKRRKGEVIDAFLSWYHKTHFRAKCNGELSTPTQ